MEGERHRNPAPFDSARDREEDKEIEELRELFIKDFPMFILNNVLMSVQFFENYERDVESLRERCLEERSIENGQFRCFNADSLHELVGSRVLFQRKTGAKKESPQLMHPIRTYVIYQNVELAYLQSSPNKNKPQNLPHIKLIVQACQDDAKEEAGFVNLIEQETAEDRTEIGAGATFISHLDAAEGASDVGQSRTRDPVQSDCLVAKNNNIYYLEPERRSKPRTLSTYRTYERITSSSSIPKSCFKESERKMMANAGRRVGLFKGRQEVYKDVQKMLISSAFKRHFCEVFVTKLAPQMKLEKLNPDAATFHHGSINATKGFVAHQIVPVLQLKEWVPCATDFPSSEFRNVRNRVEWPTKNMQDALKKTGCMLIPIGYHEASSEGSDYTLEWKMDFPKAEKYLMLHMMHAHTRCYLFVLIMYKTFIETQSSSVHFGPQHIANLLLLLVRKNFLTWPECKQGESLIGFLKILCKSLQRRRLKSFFLHKRNLYATSPLRVIHRAQILLMRILENPIPYVLKALMNLKYKEKFYPELDFQQLYKVLTVEDLGDYLNPKPQEKSRRGKARQKTESGNNEQQRKDEPGIDVEKMFDEQNTPLLRKELLRIFINHFIAIGNWSKKYENRDQAMLYLRHARHLIILLGEEYVSPSEIHELQERIGKAWNRCAEVRKMPVGKADSLRGKEESLAFAAISRRDFVPSEAVEDPDGCGGMTDRTKATKEVSKQPENAITKL